MVDARKQRYGPSDLSGVFKGATRVLAARGKKVLEIELSPNPADSEDLQRAVLGPSGNLRAPTLRVGTTIVVGFNPDVYADLFA